MKKILIVTSIGISTLIVMALVYMNFGLFWTYEERKAEMKDYLEDKYKDEMVLEDIHFGWKNGGRYYTYAQAISTKRKFDVGVSSDGVFEDGYVLDYWNSDGVALIKPQVLNYYDDISHVSFDVYFENKVPDFKAMATSLDKIKWDITIQLDYQLESQNEIIEFEKIKQTIDGLKTAGFKLDNIKFKYIDKYVKLNRDDLRKFSSRATN